jgi:hypothetical protein
MNMYKSRSGSNQPEPLSIEFPTSTDKQEVVDKLKGKRRKKEVDKRLQKIFCCNSIALQWAQGAKDLSLVVLH